jgi:lipid-A-disaccharide synthase
MMGFIEILPYAFNLMARISLTIEDIEAKRPDVVLTIDSPGFCFRVVKKLRENKLPSKFIHYVAPTVWAYKPERAVKCAALFDHMLVLLPFEPPYFTQHGLGCTFIGHPVVAETQPGSGDIFREKYNIAKDAMLLCLLPGSRKGEVDRHMPVFGQAITMLAQKYPGLAMVVAVPRHVLPFVAAYFEGCPFRTVITADEQDKKNAIAASNLAIVKSGTVTLEVAMSQTPMVVAYRVNPVSAWMMRRMMTTKYANLVNILLKKEAIPELLQENCTPLMIANAASQLLLYPELQTQQKLEAAAALKQLYPGRPPSDAAAEKILELAG